MSERSTAGPATRVLAAAGVSDLACPPRARWCPGIVQWRGIRTGAVRALAAGEVWRSSRAGWHQRLQPVVDPLSGQFMRPAVVQATHGSLPRPPAYGVNQVWGPPASLKGVCRQHDIQSPQPSKLGRGAASQSMVGSRSDGVVARPEWSDPDSLDYGRRAGPRWLNQVDMASVGPTGGSAATVQGERARSSFFSARMCSAKRYRSCWRRLVVSPAGCHGGGPARGSEVTARMSVVRQGPCSIRTGVAERLSQRRFVRDRASDGLTRRSLSGPERLAL